MLSTRSAPYWPGCLSLYDSTRRETAGNGASDFICPAHSVAMLVPRAVLPDGNLPVRK